jgi:hypothetical protein
MNTFDKESRTMVFIETRDAVSHGQLGPGGGEF